MPEGYCMWWLISQPCTADPYSWAEFYLLNLQVSSLRWNKKKKARSGGSSSNILGSQSQLLSHLTTISPSPKRQGPGEVFLKKKKIRGKVRRKWSKGKGKNVLPPTFCSNWKIQSAQHRRGSQTFLPKYKPIQKPEATVAQRLDRQDAQKGFIGQATSPAILTARTVYDHHFIWATLLV